jgi:acyl CoA:acetate/3-ketoacid CoA transferase beta subunit
MSASYTLEELLIARMAREYRGNAIGVGATILSDLSARLARALWVPDMFLMTASRGSADPDVSPKSLCDEWVLDRTSHMSLDWVEMFQLVAQNRLQIWLGAVQIDRLGGSNISVLGNWDKPKVQMVGARGVPDDLWGCERLCYHMRRQTTRSFVEKVDFVCSFGYGERRAQWGERAAKPGIVVSDLGVYDFDPASGMRIVSLHPGVSFEDAQKKTGFALPRPAGDISVTAEPTAEELRVIREVIDPQGIRRLDGDGGDALLMELWQQEMAQAGVPQPSNRFF